MRRLAWVYWIAMVPVYWYCAFRLLEHMSPVSIDGGGPTATFWWGEHPPTPTLTEDRQDTRFPRQFACPYCVAAAIVTALGYLAACLRRSGWMALSLFLLAAAISDCGDVLRLWHGTRLLFDVYSFWVLLIEFMIPMSLLTWLLAAEGKAINLSREHPA